MGPVIPKEMKILSASQYYKWQYGPERFTQLAFFINL